MIATASPKAIRRFRVMNCRLQHRTQPLPAGPQAAPGTLRKSRGPGNHDGGTVSANPAWITGRRAPASPGSAYLTVT